MTAYDTANTTGRAQNVNATLIIDGVPVAFSTVAGLSFLVANSVADDGGVFVTDPGVTFTTVDALVAGTLSLDGQKIDYDKMLVPPSGASCSIRLSSSWDKYFERRRTPQTLVVTEVTDNATSISVQSTTGFSAGDVIYIDREAIKVNTLSSTAFTSVTRNYCALPGTKAARHSVLAVVGSSPRYLVGRSATLWLWNTTSGDLGDVRLARRLRISGVKHNPSAGAWELSFSDAMDMFDRKIAGGFHALPVWATTRNNDGTTDFSLGLNGDVNRELETSATLQSHVLLSSATNAVSVIAEIQSITSGAIKCRSQDVAAVVDDSAQNGWETVIQQGDDGATYFGQVANTSGLTAQRVYVFTGSPMLALLQVLHSNRGDGANDATYDVLFGISSTSTGTTRALSSFENECKFGADVSPLLLNMTGTGEGALNNPELLAEYPPGWRYVLGPKESSLVDLMVEVAWAHNGFFYFDASGQLSFKRLTAVNTAYTTVAATLTEDEILRMSPLTAVDDESEIVHTFKLKCNFDPIADKTTTTVNIYHPLTAETYRDTGQTIELVRRGLSITPNTLSMEETAERFNRIFARRQYGIRKYSVTLPWRYHTIVPGDVVSVTHSALNNFEGSTLSADYFEVASTGALNFNEGTVELELHETWEAKPFAPTAKISSWDTPSLTATLVTSDKYTGDATPGDFFAVGWKVYVLDKNASPPFSEKSAVLTITAKTSTTITLSALPDLDPGAGSEAPAAGDIIVMANYADSDNATANVEQSLSQRGYAFQSDSNYNLATGVNADVWG